MAIQAVSNGTAATAAATTPTKSTTFDKNAFLNLLVTQLKYQDPMDPMKANDFMSQLAQISQVEQLQNISGTLDAMKQASQTGSMTNWISTIGKKMNVDSSLLSKGDQVYFTPAGDFDRIVLTLKNLKDGSTKQVSIQKGEPLVYTHDSDDPVMIAASAYKNNQLVGCQTSAYRIVQGIDISSGAPMLVSGTGESFSVDKVKQIKE